MTKKSAMHWDNSFRSGGEFRERTIQERPAAVPKRVTINHCKTKVRARTRMLAPIPAKAAVAGETIEAEKRTDAAEACFLSADAPNPDLSLETREQMRRCSATAAPNGKRREAAKQ